MVSEGSPQPDGRQIDQGDHSGDGNRRRLSSVGEKVDAWVTAHAQEVGRESCQPSTPLRAPLAGLILPAFPRL